MLPSAGVELSIAWRCFMLSEFSYNLGCQPWGGLLSPLGCLIKSSINGSLSHPFWRKALIEQLRQDAVKLRCFCLYLFKFARMSDVVSINASWLNMDCILHKYTQIVQLPLVTMQGNKWFLSEHLETCLVRLCSVLTMWLFSYVQRIDSKIFRSE